ncbi:unnamed protein product [Pylaiella littoralis]
MATKLAKTFGQEIVEKSATELGGRVVGTEEEDKKFSSSSFIDGMAEGIVLAAAWFTVRMICQVSYKAVKSYREGKQQKNLGSQPPSNEFCKQVFNFYLFAKRKKQKKSLFHYYCTAAAAAAALLIRCLLGGVTRHMPIRFTYCDSREWQHPFCF